MGYPAVTDADPAASTDALRLHAPLRLHLLACQGRPVSIAEHSTTPDSASLIIHYIIPQQLKKYLTASMSSRPSSSAIKVDI